MITFKKLYTDKISTLKITDIGFEDYYLIHDLFCHKNNIQNSERFVIRESMRKAYLHAIFNDGKLNELYKNYPKIFINYLIRFDNIFTTNYDSNIELAIGKKFFIFMDSLIKEVISITNLLYETNYLMHQLRKMKLMKYIFIFIQMHYQHIVENIKNFN